MAAVKQSCTQINEPRPAVGVLKDSSVPSPSSPQPCKRSDMAEEIKELKNEIKELKEDLKYERRFRIKAERELREWKEMHAVVQELKGTVGEIKMCISKHKPDTLQTSSSQKIGSQIQEPCSAQGSKQVVDYINLGEGVRIKRSQFDRINTQDFKKNYQRAFPCNLWARNTCHSLSKWKKGTQCRDQQGGTSSSHSVRLNRLYPKEIQCVFI
ncbi:uncharacterized protein LOC132116310 [Carassius carassius]|uniref:uncharacterized protein LOC132116310 n=1 Tax=Carassius carassius TaxID=217509 RepID=UPI002868CA90|nr:uncharacterized protein LOC132116310 [Carassius carassius]